MMTSPIYAVYKYSKSRLFGCRVTRGSQSSIFEPDILFHYIGCQRTKPNLSLRTATFISHDIKQMGYEHFQIRLSMQPCAGYIPILLYHVHYIHSKPLIITLCTQTPGSTNSFFLLLFTCANLFFFSP